MPKKKISKNTKIAAGVGAGLAAVAAGVGAYLLSKPKNRKKVGSWVNAAKKEVAKQLRETKQLNKETYEAVVTAVLSRYKKLREIEASEIVQVARELKGHWNSISKQLRPAGKKTAARKPVKASRKSKTPKKR